MKKSLLSFLAGAAIFAVSLSSCTSDPCKDVNCGTNGTCVEGTCSCDAGYEGTNCGTEVRTKFLGTYTVAEDCSASAASSYIATITADATSIQKVKITNFWGLFNGQVSATVEGNNISIARQAPDSDGYYVVGTGVIAGTVITWNYTVTDETDPANILSDNCTTTTYTK
jgi:hypothetical protein